MNYIGIDVHERICTAVVLDDNEIIVDQIVILRRATRETSCFLFRLLPNIRLEFKVNPKL